MSTRQESQASGNVLWVDDEPENNAAEINALSAFGYSVTTVRNTRQALSQIAVRKFVAVISDMGRSEGPHEGYVLLDKIRSLNNSTPFFIYAGSSRQDHVQESLDRGAQGCTSEMRALIEFVRSAAKTGDA